MLDLKRKIGTEGLCLSAKVNLRGMSGRGLLMGVDQGPAQLRMPMQFYATIASSGGDMCELGLVLKCPHHKQ